MALNRIGNCLTLAALLGSASAALAANPQRQTPAAEPAPLLVLGQASYALSDGALPPAAAVQASSRALAREGAAGRAGKKATEFSNVTVGPSWSYQASRGGPLFEMGALGGGTVEDRPRLAHVAFAWQF